MNFENSISPASSTFLRSDVTQFNQNGETFRDILQRMLNYKSGTRPPKIELTGILIPYSEIVHGYQCKFKLETDSNEYFLRMNDSIIQVAKKIEWEKVTVKGFLDPDAGLFEAEKISLVQRSEPIRPTVDSMDSNFELDQFKRIIAQRGKLELAPEYLAS